MKVQDLLSEVAHASGNSQSNVRLLYGQSELSIVEVLTDEHNDEVVLLLDEKRDLSDPEKHEG